MGDVKRLGELIEDIRSLIERSGIDPTLITGETAREMQAVLGHFPEYSNATPEFWNELGVMIKRQGGTAAVYSGCLPALLWYLYRNPKGLPMTPSYAMKHLGRGRVPVKVKGLSGDAILAILAGEGAGSRIGAEYVIYEPVAAREIKKASHTREDGKMVKSDPNATVYLYFAGEDLIDLVNFINSKTRIGLQVEALDCGGDELRESRRLESLLDRAER